MARSDYTHKMVNGERVDLTDAEIDECVARETEWNNAAPTRAWAALRLERDSKLAATDHYGLSDVTLSDEMKSYRQKLRDLPATLDNTTVQGDITWPSEPS